MNVKRVEKSDLQELWDIHKKFYNYAFPDLSNPLYIFQRVVRDENGEVITASVIKITCEGLFITNKDASHIKIIKAIKRLITQLREDCSLFGLEECHIFSENDDHYINILRKLGFTDCTGFPMVIQGIKNVQKSTEEHV